MAVLWFGTFVLLFWSTSSLQHSNIRLTNSCPSSYDIPASKGSVVRIEVLEKENACDRIPKLSKRKDVQIVNDLSPTMTVDTRGDQSVVNISWTVTVINGKLPRMVLLELTKYVKVEDEYIHSKDCVLFRLRNRRLKLNEAPPTMFFDCVELVGDRDVYLGVQVWCLPNSASVSRSCQTRLKRSLSMQRPCQRKFGEIICSRDELFPLSLDSHIAGICHCSDRPYISLTKLSNGSFQLDAWNLPQYAYEVQFDVYRGVENVYSEILGGTTRVSESKSITTKRKFGPGNYTFVVTPECYGDIDDVRASGRDCTLMDSVMLNYPIEVPHPPTTQLYGFQPLEHTLLPIGVAVILSSLITLVVFCVCRKRMMKQQDRSGDMFEMQPLSPRNNERRGNEPRLLARARQKSEKMLVYHPDDKDHMKCIAELKELCKQQGVLLVDEEPSITDQNFRIDDNITSNGSSMTDQKDCFGQSPGLRANWRDFAEKAGTEYTEVVIVLSRGLYEICEAYRDRSLDKEALNALRKERQYDIVPCVVLQKLQTLIQENPYTDSFSVHIISFETDTKLIEKFCNTFNFLKRFRNCYAYTLSSTYDNQTNNMHSGRLNNADLKLLLQRLKGLAENEDSYSVIDTAVSNQNFGSDLRSALHEKLADINRDTEFNV